MSSTYSADIHWIYVFFSHIFGNIFYVVFHLFFRYNSCNNTGKSAAMYSADTAADLVQEQLGKSKNQRDFLLVAVFNAVAVLKQFPGGSSGFIHQLQKFLVICLTNCLCCPFYTGSLFKEVDGTENCSVVLNLVYMCKQIFKSSLMKKLCTKYAG